MRHDLLKSYEINLHRSTDLVQIKITSRNICTIRTLLVIDRLR